MRRHLPYLAIFVCILLTGCGVMGGKKWETPPSNGETGTVAVQATLSALETSGSTPTSGEVVLTKNKTTITVPLTITDGRASGSADIPTGRWDATVKVKDADQDVIFQGTGVLDVAPNATSTLAVTLAPAPGYLNLSVDVSGLPNQAELQKAKLLLSPGSSYRTLERTPETTRFESIVELAPKSHDIKVDLYTSSTHSYNLAHEGVWMPITILPGKTLTLLWKPALGQVSIDASVENVPHPPQNLTASYEAGLIHLSWQPGPNPEGDVRSYTVYAKADEYSAYEQIAQVAAPTTQYQYTLTQPTVGQRYSYTVTATDGAGYESPRSEPVHIVVP